MKKVNSIPNDTPIPFHVRLAVWNKCDGHCYYCAAKIEASDFHVDHKEPRWLGGSNELDNLAATCPSCNREKGGLTEAEFFAAKAKAIAARGEFLTSAKSLGEKRDRRTVNIETAGKILGISRAVAYDLARRDQLPVPIIRLGNRMVISLDALETVLRAQHPEEAQP